MTYSARHVSRTATNPNLFFDRSHRLLRQLFTLVEFHEQQHTFVFLIFCHLTNYEAVHYPLNGVTIGSGGWSGKARVKDIVDLGRSKPDATRVPKSSRDEGSAVSIISTGRKKKRQWLRMKNSGIVGTQESVTHNTPSLLPSITRPPELPILDSVSST